MPLSRRHLLSFCKILKILTKVIWVVNDSEAQLLQTAAHTFISVRFICPKSLEYNSRYQTLKLLDFIQRIANWIYKDFVILSEKLSFLGHRPATGNIWFFLEFFFVAYVRLNLRPLFHVTQTHIVSLLVLINTEPRCSFVFCIQYIWTLELVACGCSSSPRNTLKFVSPNLQQLSYSQRL